MGGSKRKKSVRMTTAARRLSRKKAVLVSLFREFPFLWNRKTVSYIRTSNIFFIMRGLPGSGKSTVVRAIRTRYKKAVVCSADEFFIQEDGTYAFEPGRLEEAHRKCVEKAQSAAEKGMKNIIIDNTNILRWEMTKYFALAQKFNYSVLLVEPRTPWKLVPVELAQRNTHGCPLEQIEKKQKKFREVLPIYWGWFFNDSISRELLAVGASCFDVCMKNVPEFAEYFYTLAASKGHNSPIRFTDLFQVKGATLHCTTFFSGSQKERMPGTAEYAARKEVQLEMGQVFSLKLVGVMITPRTVGIRIGLNRTQLLLWGQEDTWFPPAAEAAASDQTTASPENTAIVKPPGSGETCSYDEKQTLGSGESHSVDQKQILGSGESHSVDQKLSSHIGIEVSMKNWAPFIPVLYANKLDETPRELNKTDVCESSTSFGDRCRAPCCSEEMPEPRVSSDHLKAEMLASCDTIAKDCIALPCFSDESVTGNSQSEDFESLEKPAIQSCEEDSGVSLDFPLEALSVRLFPEKDGSADRSASFTILCDNTAATDNCSETLQHSSGKLEQGTSAFGPDSACDPQMAASDVTNLSEVPLALKNSNDADESPCCSTEDRIPDSSANSSTGVEETPKNGVSFRCGTRAHMTLGSADGVSAVQTGFDQMELVLLEDRRLVVGGPVFADDVVVTYYGEGRCTVYFDWPIHRKALFTGKY